MDRFDKYLRQRIQSSGAHYNPPHDARSRLLKTARSRSEREGKLWRAVNFLENDEFGLPLIPSLGLYHVFEISAPSFHKLA
jgi:hypothetical protein